MTDQQKTICRELLKLSYRHGFESSYPLAPIAASLGLTVKELYDNNTNTGILWELGPHGNGVLDIGHQGTHAGCDMGTRGMLANWCDFRE